MFSSCRPEQDLQTAQRIAQDALAQLQARSPNYSAAELLARLAQRELAPLVLECWPVWDSMDRFVCSLATAPQRPDVRPARRVRPVCPLWPLPSATRGLFCCIVPAKNLPAAPIRIGATGSEISGAAAPSLD
jgi:hypothetical protein